MNLHEFYIGKAFDAYEYFGAHLTKNGVLFRVYAPNAEKIEVIGEFNGWDGTEDEMIQDAQSGVFECVQKDAKPGMMYKYRIYQPDGIVMDRFDPYSFGSQVRPDTASVIVDLEDYHFSDEAWMKKRSKNYDLPVNIYEVHAGSWRKNEADEENGWYHYQELGKQLIPYVKEMGYTHVEFLPLTEHPADCSWGYQASGYFCPTSRYGTAKELMEMLDLFHKEGIGVIMDFVPVHFIADTYALNKFDGTALYEYADDDKGYSEWGTCNFNYYRGEVRSFLQSSANFWMEKFHFDGIRMDAVASMLYLDYGRQDGEWIPNMYGGNENLEAIEMIKHFNSVLKKRDPGVLSIAEESTAFPLITGSLEEGGLGFDLKWNMGFMNDYLDYIKYDPYFRSHHHGELTFSMIYAYSEKFMLVFSHDEVVHGKGTLLGKMPGDRAQKLANLRLTYGYMMTHPGKKLLFMGQDLAEEKEWNEMRQVEWQLEEQKENAGVQKLVKDLNVLYRENKALYECDDQAKGFQWMNEISANECYVSFVRKGEEAEELLLVVANFSGVPREITTGVPYEGKYKEILNTDAVCYGGTGVVNDRMKRAEDLEWDDKKQSVTVKLAPLSLSILQFIPYTEAELEKVIEKRIRKNTPIRKTTNKTAKKKQEK